MAYEGTQTVTTDRTRVLKISTAGLDADAEVGASVDLNDYMKGVVSFQYGLAVTRTAGTNDTIDVALQGSLDNTYWTDIVTVTSPNSQGGISIDYGEPATDPTTLPYRYFRILCTTVGNNNTLTGVGYVGVK